MSPGPGWAWATPVHMGKAEVDPRDSLPHYWGEEVRVSISSSEGLPSWDLKEDPSSQGENLQITGFLPPPILLQTSVHNPPRHPSAPGRALSGAAETMYGTFCAFPGKLEFRASRPIPCGFILLDTKLKGDGGQQKEVSLKQKEMRSLVWN